MKYFVFFMLDSAIGKMIIFSGSIAEPIYNFMKNTKMKSYIPFSLLVAFIFLLILSACSKSTPDPIRSSASTSNTLDENIVLVSSDSAGSVEIQTGKLTHPIEFSWTRNGISATNKGSVVYDLALNKNSSAFSFGIVGTGMTTAALSIPLLTGINQFEVSYSDAPTVLINGHVIHTDGFKGEDMVVTDDRGEGYVRNEVNLNFVGGTPVSEKYRIFRDHNLFLTGLNDIIGMYTVRIDDGRNPYSVVRELATEQSVKNPVVNGLVKVCWPNDMVWSPYWPDDYRWAMKRIHANEGWDIYKDGTLDEQGDANVDNVVMCIVDTGLWLHEDFNKSYWHTWASKKYSINFIYPGTPPLDYYGHGISVAGIATAQGNNGKGIAGVSWGAYLLSIKSQGDDGWGTWESVANSVTYIAQLADLYPWLKFIGNFSLGGFQDDPNMRAASVDAGTRANLLFVAAVGNNNGPYADSFYPSAYAEFMSVGASSIIQVDGLDKEVTGECPFGWGTNYGYTVDVCAPGTLAITTTNVPWTIMYDNLDPNCPVSCTTWYCQYFAGTSSATPHVAGLAALLWNKHPEWTRQQVIDKIKSTTDPMAPSPGKEGQLGTGRINVYRALTE